MSLLKRSFILLLSTLFIISGMGLTAFADEGATKTITILHTNDTHAKVKPGDGGMGFAKLAAIVKELEAENPNTLLLDAGDTFHGTPFATVEQGESIAEILNALDYDGLAAGNHDFNYGADRLLELRDLVNFPVISANVRYKADQSRFLDPYFIEEVEGIRLGIFGLTTPETHYKTNPKNVEDLNFTDPVEEAKEMVALLEEEGVDMIIAVTHLGIDASSTDTSIRVAEGAPGIDLIVDGHSHSTLVEGQAAGEDTLIVSAGEHTKNLGVVTLTFEENTLVDKSARLIMQEEVENVEADAEVQALIDAIDAEQNELLSEVIGTTDVDLQGERDFVRTGETNLGNLITDAMLAATGADVALTNGGGIRASIEKGDITKGQVVNVLPFGNYVVTKTVTGADLKAALEHGTSDYPNAKGAFPHVAGMTFEIDTAAPAGSRVKNVQIGGEDLDLEAEYVLATNDFIAVGGDDYTMLAGGELINEYSGLDEILIDYIQATGAVNSEVEGRIVVVEGAGADEEEQDEGAAEEERTNEDEGTSEEEVQDEEEGSTEQPSFTDVSADRWSYSYIQDLVGKNVIKGTSDTTFSPTESLTRVQFASLLVRAFGLEAEETTPFTDIGQLPEDIQKEVVAAYGNGLIKGVNDDEFAPNDKITRGQMVLMLKRAYELQTGTTLVSEGAAPFTDIDGESAEMRDAIAAAYELGLVEGYGQNIFKPGHSATREESAKVLSILLKLIES